MQLGLGPLVGSALGIGSGVAALETLVYANKYVILPVVEHGVAGIYGVLGEDRLRTWQEIEYARNTYFNPLFDNITSLNETMKDYIELYVGRDLDGDGLIGENENPNTDKTKSILSAVDKGNQ